MRHCPMSSCIIFCKVTSIMILEIVLSGDSLLRELGKLRRYLLHLIGGATQVLVL